jgi:hypothetical protein
MHGDDVGRLNPICEHREVSGYAPQAVGLTRLGFTAGGVEIGQRRIDKRG